MGIGSLGGTELNHLFVVSASSREKEMQTDADIPELPINQVNTPKHRVNGRKVPGLHLHDIT
ncbi:hypothetical protein EYF80_039435 [Liparis tanakae]|uniref:Uncharacterized protein n=1 Tax=Liparis tanakae TaxID=230148 RepID=A0A4Z2GBR7_9TELE|nr:hypothetical protein EYF80_039435 [Liparis tanakae]